MKCPNIAVQPGVSKLAIDVGGVLSQQDTDNVGSKSVAELLETSHPSAESAEVCRLLASRFGCENTFVLSKCKSRVQIATVRFLTNPIADLHQGQQSFLDWTGIPPRNILFCMERSGGDAPVRLVPLFDGDPRNGPRTASDKRAGKGAIAATLGLTHMIDDRADCLLSFFWEGGAWNRQPSGAWGKKKASKKKKLTKKSKHKDDDDTTVNETSNTACITLFHFGERDAAGLPTTDRISAFGLAHGGTGANLEEGTRCCQKNWIPVANWEAFLPLCAESIVTP